MLVYWLDIVGTAVFAISGVLLAGKLRMDPFGVLVLGVVTAVGGGTIRDMALDNGPVFWVKDPTDLVVAMVTSMLTILLVRQPRRLPKWMLPVLDAVGLAVSFVVAWASIRWLMRLISHHTLEAFGWYRIALSLVVWWMLVG